MPDPRFSIVIPARNAAASLPLVLGCLQRQEAPDNLAEILVVDDGSTDATAQVLRDHRSRFPFKYWSHPVSLGRSAARNLAWRNAVGEIVLFLDADMLTEPQWLSGYAEAFTQSDREVLSGGRYSVDLGGDPGALRERLAAQLDVPPDRLFVENVEGQWHRLVEAAHLGQYPKPVLRTLEEQLKEVCRDCPDSLLCAYSLITSNVGIRRTWLDRVHGFDPYVRRSQDTDLGFRLWEAGARFGYAPSSKAYHLYTSIGRDHPTDAIEITAFLHRHPYLLVSFYYLWHVYNAQDAPPAPSPIFASLPLLAREGAALMDVDVVREFARVRHNRPSADCQYSREAVAAFLVETTGVARDRADAWIDLALDRGVFAQRRNGRVYLDLLHTLNWLRTRTTLQEFSSSATNYLRTHKTAYFKTRKPENRLTLHCHGAYEVTIDLQAIAGNAAHATLDLPVPVETQWQTNVRIDGAHPPDLLDYLDADTRIIHNLPIHACGDEPLIVRYDFSCYVHERPHGADTEQDTEAPIREADLQPTYPPTTLAQLRSLLPRILTEGTASVDDAARVIYHYVLDNTYRLQSSLPDFSIVTTGFGPCIHRVRLFTNLCRLVGIPARERCGAIFQGPVDPAHPSRLVIRERGFSPFLHTWAEYYQGRWVPIEFMAWGCGRRVMTSQNMTDAALRHELEQDTDLFDTYYFGALDPYRIHCSAEINRQAPYPVVAEAARTPPHKLFWHTRHRLTIEFETLDKTTVMTDERH